MLKVYGLKNCDTCRKALKWLASENIDHAFSDLRQDGIDAEKVSSWISAVGWETLLNRKSTTWRGLPDAVKASVGGDTVADLLVAHPTLIKRPVFDRDGNITVGFKEAARQNLR